MMNLTPKLVLCLGIVRTWGYGVSELPDALVFWVGIESPERLEFCSTDVITVREVHDSSDKPRNDEDDVTNNGRIFSSSYIS